MSSKLQERLLPDSSDQLSTSDAKSNDKISSADPRKDAKVIKNIVLLALAWALTLTTSTLLTTIGPLSSVELGASNSLAAFAVGVFLLGAAASSVPSASLFAKYGRFYGFSLGCLCQMAGSFIGATAIALKLLPFIYLGCFFVGLGQGLGQFYRFSAIEVSPPELKSKAITYVLSGGVIAAFLGPICADNTADLVEGNKFIGSYLIIALIGLLNEVTICFVDFPKPNRLSSTSEKVVAHSPSRNQSESVERMSFKSASAQEYRTLGQIVTQPLFILSCFVATVAHTIMVMLMSDVTLAMSDYGYSLKATSLVMELHFFSMFGPGFISGKLIMVYGSFVIALIGGLIFGASAAVFLIGTSSWNFYLGMILLGIGWNFSFSAGTVMLTDSYKPHEATRVQAINDFILFTIAGIGSLAAGFIYSYFGWQITVFVALAMVVGNLLVFFIAYRLKIDKTEKDGDKTGRSISRSNRPSFSSVNDRLRTDVDDDADEEEEAGDPLILRKNSYDFRNAFSFDGMDETTQGNTIRSFSAA